MRMQLKVVKAGGTVEDYLHTKVIGTICNALAVTGQADTHIAEELAEVVTSYLYHKYVHLTINSSEVFSVIQAVLSATGYESAAEAITDHHFQRRLRRLRIEVVSADVQDLADAGLLSGIDNYAARSSWNKARIVKDLVAKHGLTRQTARTIASMVEQKVFDMSVTTISTSLIKQLVISDAARVLHAEKQLQMA